ncbi:MAG TPA: sporulation protein YqfD [Oscillospiraceae bacterium]|nr:sporulation protein YqfD [Oscillospiraceae bacterium]HPF56640.1 sporulation protein YqfD [Clostridiales bacterium]HPK36627.1 sporulation protein YqfD [Oscillospiraceae bacterium]HPR76841.1 sporulation protein YqfD [Oscillospiraceae bacterium]
MLKLLRFILGYLEIEIRGGFFERFLTLCTNAGVKLWGITQDGEAIRVCVRRSAFKKLRKYRRMTHVKIKIVARHGLFEIVRRYKLRVGFAVGAILFFALFFVMSQFIWTIDISGNERLNEDEILYTLERCGIVTGMQKNGFDPNTAVSRLYLENSEIAWIALNVKGTTLYVELRERVYPPDMLPQNRPCNVVSAYTGQVIRMYVYDGKPEIQTGDAVVNGQLLVSGVLEDREGAVRYTHARASVIGAARIEKQVTIGYSQTKIEISDDEKIRYEFGILSLKIPLYFSKPDLTYDRSETVKRLTVFGAEFPIYIRKITFREVIESEYTLTEEQALAYGMSELALFETEDLAGAKITARDIQKTVTDQGIILSAVYSCEIEMALEQEIMIEFEN